jgi:hypothetical protein
MTTTAPEGAVVVGALRRHQAWLALINPFQL